MQAGYRRRADGGWYPACGVPLSWAELNILVRGWARDDRFHTHRAAFPDWEWDRVDNWFASQMLLALQGANWQRSGGKGERPKRVTPALLRGDLDESVVSRSGVAAGRRRGRAGAVSCAADLGLVRERMEARRRAAAGRS